MYLKIFILWSFFRKWEIFFQVLECVHFNILSVHKQLKYTKLKLPFTKTILKTVYLVSLEITEKQNKFECLKFLVSKAEIRKECYYYQKEQLRRKAITQFKFYMKPNNINIQMKH